LLTRTPFGVRRFDPYILRLEGGAQWWATGLENQAMRSMRVRLLHLPLHGVVGVRVARLNVDQAERVRLPYDTHMEL
jgi:hypothetical protein